jgi:hypothetical protein
MKKVSLFVAILGTLLVLFSTSPALSQDTSPYLLGTWESGVYTITTPITTTYQDSTDWQIANPTTKPLNVYAVFSSANGQFLTCTATTIPPNGVALFSTWGWNDNPYAVGTVKFFAFPVQTRKFDPNAVIGGFQGKTHVTRVFLTETTAIAKANLKAVTINSSTIGEFSTKIPFNNCPFFTVDD